MAEPEQYEQQKSNKPSRWATAGVLMAVMAGGSVAGDLEPAQRVKVNDAFYKQSLEEIRQNPEAFLTATDTSYSRSVLALREEYQQQVNLAAENNPPFETVLLNPHRFTMARMVGFDKDESLNLAMHDDRHTQVSKPMVKSLLHTDIDHAAESPTSVIHQEFSAAEPSVRYYSEYKDRLFLTPEAEFGSLENLGTRGLNQKDDRTFTNYHEAWHLLQSHYLPNNATEKMCETFADLGGVGEMIRKEGASTDIIDKLAKERLVAMDTKSDLGHFSTAGLLTLKDRIDDMGIDAFKAMNQQDLGKLYAEVSVAATSTVENKQYMKEYQSADTTSRFVLNTQALFDNDVAQGVAIAQKTLVAQEELPDLPRGASAQKMQEVQQALDAWDKKGELIGGAFELGGKVTPQTLALAYTRMQDGLEKQLAADPDNPLYALKMAALKHDAPKIVKNMDYYTVNKQQGIDITESLNSRFLPKTPEAPPETPPETPVVEKRPVPSQKFDAAPRI